MNKTLDRLTKLAYKTEWSLLAAKNDKEKSKISNFYEADTGWHRQGIDRIVRFDGTALVEPTYGYIISEQGYLIEDSLVPNAGGPTDVWRHAMPSPAKFREVMENKSSIAHYPKIVSLRHLWEWNYFHFYTDVLGRLKLIDSVFGKDIPLLLGNYVDDVPFAKQIIEHSGLSDRQWIMPGHDYVMADEIYYCQTGQSWRSRLAYIVNEMDLPKPNAVSKDRIFLMRPQSATRHITNQSSIDPVLTKHGFRTVDTSNMNVKEQIELFANARHVIAVHGAGIVNVMFRDGAPMSLIELRPDVYLTPDMKEMCGEYGYTYASLIGKADGGPHQHANFALVPDELDQKITEVLSS